MTTAEVQALEAEFRHRAEVIRAAGNSLNASTWGLAADLLIDAESRSLAASLDRSRLRRARAARRDAAPA